MNDHPPALPPAARLLACAAAAALVILSRLGYGRTHSKLWSEVDREHARLCATRCWAAGDAPAGSPAAAWLARREILTGARAMGPPCKCSNHSDREEWCQKGPLFGQLAFMCPNALHSHQNGHATTGTVDSDPHHCQVAQEGSCRANTPQWCPVLLRQKHARDPAVRGRQVSSLGGGMTMLPMWRKTGE
jgi:hypothetical protein